MSRRSNVLGPLMFITSAVQNPLFSTALVGAQR